MKRLVPVLLLAGAMMLLVSGMAFAQAGKVELKYGSFNPAGDLEDDEWEKGTSWELAGTYRESNMGVQGAIGRYTTEFNEDYYDVFLGNIEEDDSITIIPVTLSFLGFYDSGPLHLYGGVGIGYYFAEVEGEFDFKDVGYTWKDSDKDSVFGYHAMGGLEYDVTSNFLIGLEGRLVRTNEAKFDLEDDGLETEYETELNGNIFALKLGFRF